MKNQRYIITEMKKKVVNIICISLIVIGLFSFVGTILMPPIYENLMHVKWDLYVPLFLAGLKTLIFIPFVPAAIGGLIVNNKYDNIKLRIMGFVLMLITVIIDIFLIYLVSSWKLQIL